MLGFLGLSAHLSLFRSQHRPIKGRVDSTVLFCFSVSHECHGYEARGKYLDLYFITLATGLHDFFAILALLNLTECFGQQLGDFPASKDEYQNSF